MVQAEAVQGTVVDRPRSGRPSNISGRQIPRKADGVGHQTLCELHVIPPKTKIDTTFYVENVVKKSCFNAINRTPSKASVIQRRMVAARSQSIFMLDGALAHRSATVQQWCRDNMPHFWAKEECPGNSPDLNPIEELWAIVQQELDNDKSATNLA